MSIKSFAVAGVLALVAAAPAAAADYQFQYVFNTGEVVTGSFSGDQNGNLVTNISNTAVAIDNIAFDGPVFSYGFFGYNGPSGPNNGGPESFTLDAATVSFDPLLNNFLFINTIPGEPNNDLFYIFPWSNGGGNQVATQAVQNGVTLNFYNGDYVPQNWSLTLVSAPESAVPEPTTWLMLLSGFGLVGVMARRRTVPVVA